MRIVRIALIPKDYEQQPQTVGEHLKKRRKELGLLQRQVAKVFGVNRFTIMKWEDGRSNPALKDIPALVMFLGYDPEPPSPQTVAEYLFAKRRALGWSQRKAAASIGVDHNTWMYWEQGGVIRIRKHRSAIADFLGLAESIIEELSSMYQ